MRTYVQQMSSYWAIENTFKMCVCLILGSMSCHVISCHVLHTNNSRWVMWCDVMWNWKMIIMIMMISWGQWRRKVDRYHPQLSSWLGYEFTSAVFSSENSFWLAVCRVTWFSAFLLLLLLFLLLFLSLFLDFLHCHLANKLLYFFCDEVCIITSIAILKQTEQLLPSSLPSLIIEEGRFFLSLFILSNVVVCW